MPIDSSIALGVQAPQNPLAQYAQLAQLKNAQQQGELAQVQVENAQRDQLRKNKLTELLSSGGTPEEVETRLRGGGYLDESLKFGKDRRENAKLENESMKAKREAEAAQFKLAHDKTNAYLNIVSSAKDQPSYLQALQQAQALGLDVSSAPQQFDQAFIANAGQQAMTQLQRLEQFGKERGYNIQELAQKETARHNKVSEGIQGGQLGVSRDRLKFDQGQAAGAVTYQPDANGNLVALPTKIAAGAPVVGRTVTGPDGQPLSKGDKALTETQGNATNFAARMRDASSVLIPLEDMGINASGLRTMAAGNMATNWLASSAGQQYMQGARNWVTANLRKESGAAIPDSELNNEIKKYFAQPGDRKEVIEQKRQARAVAEEGMLVQAGPGAKEVPKILNRAGPVSGNTAGAPKTVNFGDLK